MAELSSSAVPSGQVAHGPNSTLVERTIHFVYSRLPSWRDDPERHQELAEDRLNLSLCDYLDSMARTSFPMVRFSREEPQSGSRSSDVAAKPIMTADIHGRNYTKYDAFLVMEGKRLPAPSKSREREYVTGAPEITGGIQRFKLGLHGGTHAKAIMIGYIQAENAKYWWSAINEWVRDLSKRPGSDKCNWRLSDLLRELAVDYLTEMARCSSTHSRTNSSSSQIELEHLWVVMGSGN